MKGTPEKSFPQPDGTVKVIPAREGGLVKGKSVDQVFFEIAKAKKELGITDAELKASGVMDMLKKAKQVVNRDLLPGEAELKSYQDNDMLSEKGSGQPVMWFTKETPSSFPMYEGTTGVFRMLQDEIKKEGGKASGVAKVALKYGVPAALIAKFLSGDDETRKKMLQLSAMTGLAGIITLHPSIAEIAKKERLLSPVMTMKRSDIVGVGRPGMTHSDVANIFLNKYGSRIFEKTASGKYVTPEGEVITGKEALEWLKKYDPKTYKIAVAMQTAMDADYATFYPDEPVDLEPHLDSTIYSEVKKVMPDITSDGYPRKYRDLDYAPEAYFVKDTKKH